MAFTETSQTGTSNGTTEVVVVSAPGADERHVIKTISVFNADSVDSEVRVFYYDAGSERTIVKLTLDPGDNLMIDEVLTLDAANRSIKMELTAPVITTELPFTSHYGVVTE